jgi:hypothetical protein
MNARTASQPKPRHDNTTDTAAQSVASTSEQMAASVAELPKPKGKAAAGGLTAISLGQREKLALKTQLMSEARQRLAEAADLFTQGGETSTEATMVASRAAGLIYQGRVAGAISPDEVSAMLGDIWGYKMKGDSSQKVAAGHPKASKTPHGQGEAIRKRIVRATQAFEFANGEDGGRFFEGLSPDEVQPLVNELSDGKKTVWQVYDRLADIKREKSERVDAAFNPKAIDKIVAKLSEPASVERLAANDELLKAYAELKDVLAVIDEALADTE